MRLARRRFPWSGVWQSPSRTSQAVALLRAQLERPVTAAGDADAQRRICAGMRPTRRAGMREHMATRTAFFDSQVLEALGAQMPQVVILGAGYDDRALRFRSPGTRFFELDHPATQRDKARRLRRIGNSPDVTLAPADFRLDDAAGVLARAGHAASEPTLFICEGLLVYLDEETTLALLRALRSRAADASRLAASVAAHAERVESGDVVARANARRRLGRREPWQTILTADEHLALLARAGWKAEPAAPAHGGMLLVAATPS